MAPKVQPNDEPDPVEPVRPPKNADSEASSEQPETVTAE